MHPADLLGLFEDYGLKPKKKTSREWGAGCPACGGTDRCMVRPDDHDGRGGYHCRQCETYGDNIQFLRDFHGMSYADACAHVGVKASGSYASLPKLPRKSPASEPFEATPSLSPADLWQKRAGAFLDWAHEQLLATPEQLAWLAARGLPEEAVRKYRLGWNPGERGKSCLIRPRERWGLPNEEAKPDKDGKPGRPKTTFWIPRGIVVPQLGPDGQVLRLRIRRPDADRAEFNERVKYYVIPGSSMGTLVLGADRRAFIVVESELDALMLDYQVGDLVGAVSIMTARVRKVSEAAHEALSKALCILVALDFDVSGMKGIVRWAVSFPRAKRWPAPVRKDPGEAFEEGANLRAWVLAGLPPVLQPGLLPPGRTDSRGEGDAEKEAVSTESAPASTETAGSSSQRQPVSTTAPEASPLPSWAHPLSAAELALLPEGGTPLLVLCGRLQAAGLTPAVYVSAKGERGLVLHRTGTLVCDPAESGRLAALFFETHADAVLAVLNPKGLRRAPELAECVGLHTRDWGACAMLVALDASGEALAWQGWRRMEGWR